MASCSDNGNFEGPPAAGEIGAGCTSDADCSSGSCLTDPSFPGGYCISSCSGGPSCPEGSECHDYIDHSLCMDGCAAETDCREGYVCDYNICRPPCNSDRACLGEDSCYNGRCKAGCSDTADCPEGSECTGGECVALCTGNADCDPGFTCDTSSGHCEPKPGKPMGEPCTADGQCATGYCLPTRRICSVRCDGSALCPDGYVCGLEKLDKKNNGNFDGAEADCVPVQGAGRVGDTCQADGECASGHCYYGFCMEGCAQDHDCDGGQCVSVNILLAGGIPAYKGCLPRTGTATYELGTFSGAGEIRGMDIPPNAASFVLVTEVGSTSELGVVGQLTDPDGKLLYQAADQCDYYSQPNRYLYAEQYSSLFVPNAPSVKLVPGVYTYVAQATQPSLPVTVRLQLKLGRAQQGTLNINWFFLNLAGTCIPGAQLDASSAPTHSWFGKLRNNLTAILKSASLAVGKETFHNINDAGLDTLQLSSTGFSPELQRLFASSKGISGQSVNVFLVRKIEASDVSGGVILGIAGGIPGPAGVHGKVHSGAAMSMQTACYEPYGYNPAHTLAHEIGHYLGLFHNLENVMNPGYRNGQVVCPCPCGANLVCYSQMGSQWCRGLDPLPDTTQTDKNLMYFAAESTQMFEGNQLTPSQIRVMLDNPVVGHK